MWKHFVQNKNYISVIRKCGGNCFFCNEALYRKSITFFHIRLFKYTYLVSTGKWSTFWSLPSEKFGTHSTTFGMIIVGLLTDDKILMLITMKNKKLKRLVRKPRIVNIQNNNSTSNMAKNVLFISQYTWKLIIRIVM